MTQLPRTNPHDMWYHTTTPCLADQKFLKIQINELKIMN